MLPETFWGRIQYLLQQYGSSFLSGAGNTMIIAIVGTFLGCLIGFKVGIIQTIPVDKRDSAVKKTLVGFLKFIMACYVEFFRGTPMMAQAMFGMCLRWSSCSAPTFCPKTSTSSAACPVTRSRPTSCRLP